MKISYRTRRIIAVISVIALVVGWLVINPASYETQVVQTDEASQGSVEPLGVTSTGEGQDTGSTDTKLAIDILAKLEIKGRAPKTGYARTEFYSNWPNVNGCSLRQVIIKRELGDSAKLDGCDVVSGEFTESYTGSHLIFTSKSDFSKKIQIDHIVALSDAWQKGAQYQSKETRFALATDPLNLIAVDSSANQQKSDGDAATWLPPNKSFRCQYVARQVSVNYKYSLWISQAEHDAISNILQNCPKEPAVGI